MHLYHIPLQVKPSVPPFFTAKFSHINLHPLNALRCLLGLFDINAWPGEAFRLENTAFISAHFGTHEKLKLPNRFMKHAVLPYVRRLSPLMM